MIGLKMYRLHITNILPCLVLLEIQTVYATSCLKPYCQCSSSTKSAICSGLDYIPKIPYYVQTLELTHNNFHYISRRFIRNISKNNLTSISFNNNNIRYFRSDSLVDFHSLVTLNISGETFVKIEDVRDALKNITSKLLQRVVLEYNEWSHLPSDMFDHIYFTNLGFVSLANNLFTTFSISSSNRLHNLSLQDNRIQTVTVPFRNVVIETLNLADNHIVTLPSFCSNINQSYCPSLKTLDLSGNAIFNLTASLFYCLPSLQTLRLNSNRFVLLQSFTFRNIPKLQSLFIQRNHQLKIIERYGLFCGSLRELHFGYNSFRFDKSYAKGKEKFYPKKIFKNLPSLEYLDLSNNHMPSDNSILDSMFYNLGNVKQLILKNEQIRELQYGVFRRLVSLQLLILQGNYIEFWPDGTFDNLNNLKYLNLRNNRIHMLNKTSISESILNNLKILDLSENPFSCTCGSMWFRDWIRTTNVSLSSNFPKDYTCTYPTQMLGELLIEYNPTEEECPPWNPLFTVAILLSSFGFLVIVSILTVYKCHANIRNLLYLLRLRRLRRNGYLRLDNSNDFEFHAFVVYCDEDRDWVHSVLLRRLEDKGIKLCIHHREFKIGAPIVENIDEYLSKSWKVVVIMSNAFASSEWCQWEVDVVQGRRRRQGKNASVLIMLKAIDADHMTSSIKTMLQTTPYLRYRRGVGEELFWQAVVDTLRRPLTVPPIAV